MVISAVVENELAWSTIGGQKLWRDKFAWQNLHIDRLWYVAQQNLGDHANGRQMSCLVWTQSNWLGSVKRPICLGLHVNSTSTPILSHYMNFNFLRKSSGIDKFSSSRAGGSDEASQDRYNTYLLQRCDWHRTCFLCYTRPHLITFLLPSMERDLRSFVAHVLPLCILHVFRVFSPSLHVFTDPDAQFSPWF